MVRRPLGHTGFELSPIGFGAFKIGRNQGIKYAQNYELPDDAAVTKLIHGLIDLGVNFFDTAPAYGTSEERLGRALASHQNGDQMVVSTKVGETFENGRSTYDFSKGAVRMSIARSRERLGRDVLDIVFVHSDGDDLNVARSTDAVSTLQTLKREGLIRAIGFSGKTVDGELAALDWADAVMVEYHLNDRSHAAVMAEAAKRGVGVVVKKGLASGQLPAAEAIHFVLSNPNVTSMVIGGLDPGHLRQNVALAELINP